MLHVLIHIFCLLVGMHGVFEGDKNWRWINASAVALAVVNMIRL